MAKKKSDDDEDILGGIGHNSGGVIGEELRAFVERFENLDIDAKAIATDKKELMAEAKGRGFDSKVLRKVIAIRKRNADDLAEENAVLETYLHAMGMI